MSDYTPPVEIGGMSVVRAATDFGRSIERVFRDLNDVRDYGAVIDGVHDDTNGFINAYMSAPPNAVIWVPWGMAGKANIRDVSQWGITTTKNVIWKIDNVIWIDGTNLGLHLPGSFNVEGPFGGITIIRNHSHTTDTPQLDSAYTYDHTGGTGAVINNTRIKTIASNRNVDGLWNFYASTYTSTANPAVFGQPNTQVGAYLQAVRTAISDPNPSNNKGVPLEACVIEYHDFVDAPSSVRGFGITCEFDFAANGLDDDDVCGMQSIVLSQANPAGSPMSVGNIFGIFGSTNAYVKRVLAVNLPFSQAVIDLRNAVQMAGAHAIWLDDGHLITIDSSASRSIFYNGLGQLAYSTVNGQVFQINDVGTIQVAGLINLAGGNAYEIAGTPVVAARQHGWGVATGGNTSAFDASTATLAQAAGAIAAVINALTYHGLIGA